MRPPSFSFFLSTRQWLSAPSLPHTAERAVHALLPCPPPSPSLPIPLRLRLGITPTQMRQGNS